MSTQKEKNPGERIEKITEIFKSLNLIAIDLIPIVVSYAPRVHFVGTQVGELKEGNSHWNLTTDQKYLYVLCNMNGMGCIARYSLDTLKYVDKFPAQYHSCGIDIFNNELYLSEQTTLKVFNLETKEKLRQWEVPSSTAIKINAGNLYLSGYDSKIAIYNLSGKLIQEFGKRGSGDGAFTTPCGINFDENFVYICDHSNHRIQVFYLNKNYAYSHKWGKQGSGNGEFNSPFEICLYENLVYTGDSTTVQVFTKDGHWLHRFDNRFDLIRGILIIRNRLFVSQYSKSRVEIFE